MWNARDCGSARAHALEDDLPRTPSDISAFPSFQPQSAQMERSLSSRMLFDVLVPDFDEIFREMWSEESNTAHIRAFSPLRR